MFNQKSSAAFFVFKAHLPNYLSKVELVISFAEKDQVFTAVQIGHDWYMVSLTLPNGRIRTGFTYHCRKHIVRTERGGKLVKVTDEEEAPESMKKGLDGLGQVYSWIFGNTRSFSEIPMKSEKVVVNMCSRAPTSGAVVVDCNLNGLFEDTDQVFTTVKLQTGTHLSVIPLYSLDGLGYVWLNILLRKHGHYELKPEYHQHQRHVPALMGRWNILFRRDDWGKQPAPYKCMKHGSLSDDFLLYAFSVGNIYERSYEVFSAPAYINILEKSWAIQEEDEPVTPESEWTVPVRCVTHCEMQKTDLPSVNYSAKKRAGKWNIRRRSVATSMRKSIIKFFRNRFRMSVAK